MNVKMMNWGALSLSALLLTSCAQVSQEGVGTVAGGVVGGLLGSQFGGGAGKVAAAAAGTFIGAVLGGKIGQSMDKLDRLEMQRALEQVPTGQSMTWHNPDTGHAYQVKPTRTYYAADHQPCRDYMTQVIIDGRKETVYGKACRQSNGQWVVSQ